MEQTVFDKIVTGEIPVNKVYEDEHCLAFLDMHPVNIGHTLVIPKIHSRNIFDIDPQIAGHLFSVAKKIATALRNTCNAEGINITMNNEPAAGQVIFYSHIHIIPRYSTDGFEHWHGARGYNDGEKEVLTQKLSQALQ